MLYVDVIYEACEPLGAQLIYHTWQLGSLNCETITRMIKSSSCFFWVQCYLAKDPSGCLCITMCSIVRHLNSMFQGHQLWVLSSYPESSRGLYFLALEGLNYENLSRFCPGFESGGGKSKWKITRYECLFIVNANPTSKLPNHKLRYLMQQSYKNPILL